MQNIEGSSSEIEASPPMDASATASNEPLLPTGFAMPKPLAIDGNLATNRKRFKRSWDNYLIVARLNRFEDSFMTTTFFHALTSTS